MGETKTIMNDELVSESGEDIQKQAALAQDGLEQEGLESMQQRHRRERKELQASVMALKKSATKGDKKKKKEVMEQAAKLEAELDQRHKAELETVENLKVAEDNDISEQLKDTTIDDESVSSSTRVSKAQRRRDKKEAKEKERLEAIEAEAELNKTGSRQMEMRAIADLLRSRNLKPLLIPSDGDCLYASLANECRRKRGQQDIDVATLRRLAADEMRSNPSVYSPFVDDSFEEHCKKVEHSKEWGGQIEIRALSQALKAVIEVVQSEGPMVLFEPDEAVEGSPFVIAYYRHMYGLGEHYNGTQPIG